MNLEIFNYEDKNVRTINKDNQIWFVAKDVCDILEIKDTRTIIERLDEDEWGKTTVIDNLGRNQDTYILTESGVYEAVIRSNKKEAHNFKKWIRKEVLPTIRKTGGYVVNDQMFIDTYLPFADDTTKQLFANTLETVRKQNKIIIEMKPKALFADAVETAHTSILVGDMSKILRQNGINIGQNRLFQWLRDNNYLIKNGERKNMPTQLSMDKGLFEIKERTISNPNGVTRIIKTTKITGKGQIYFVHKFLES